MNIQTDASESRVASGGSPNSDLLERRLEMRIREAIPLMPRSSDSGWATREMGAAFAMAGASYLPWLAGTLEERVRGVKPNLLFCIHQWDSEGIGRSEGESGWLSRS